MEQREQQRELLLAYVNALCPDEVSSLGEVETKNIVEQCFAEELTQPPQLAGGERSTFVEIIEYLTAVIELGIAILEYKATSKKSPRYGAEQTPPGDDAIHNALQRQIDLLQQIVAEKEEMNRILRAAIDYLLKRE